MSKIIGIDGNNARAENVLVIHEDYGTCHSGITLDKLKLALSFLSGSKNDRISLIGNYKFIKDLICLEDSDEKRFLKEYNVDVRSTLDSYVYTWDVKFEDAPLDIFKSSRECVVITSNNLTVYMFCWSQSDFQCDAYDKYREVYPKPEEPISYISQFNATDFMEDSVRLLTASLIGILIVTGTIITTVILIKCISIPVLAISSLLF